jgi:alkylhydroperoxidase family enzyme
MYRHNPWSKSQRNEDWAGWLNFLATVFILWLTYVILQIARQNLSATVANMHNTAKTADNMKEISETLKRIERMNLIDHTANRFNHSVRNIRDDCNTTHIFEAGDTF